MAKQIFSAAIHYQTDHDDGHYSETIRQIIPIKSVKDGSRYGIMVGFQLSDEQLAYNRSLLNFQQQQQNMQSSIIQSTPLEDASKIIDDGTPVPLNP